MGLGAQCEAARELLPCADSDDWFDSADSLRVKCFALACAWLFEADGFGVDGAGVPSDMMACEAAGRGGGGGGFGVEGATTASEPGAGVPQSLAGIGGGGGVGG